MMQQLQQYGQLRRLGVVTNEEFEAEKAISLGGSAGVPSSCLSL
jgi:BMFP domain-containing protein YqiC